MRVDVKLLENICMELFTKTGLSESDSKIASYCLIEAEMVGISTHGVSMLPAHIRKLKKGYNLNCDVEIERCAGAFSVCNAHNTIGMVSAMKCAELALNKAKTDGLHMCLCHGANTFSAAYCYARYIVQSQMIGIVCCNSPAQMAPINGIEKLLGTNPLAIGIPAKHEDPFILDMATSAVAKSKINQAFHAGEKIPFGWATDINGNPTDDPGVAVAGLILPMAGPKGYGLSMAIDILAGLLSGASYLDNVGRFYSDNNCCMDVGHMFIVINPYMIYGDNFVEDMDKYLYRIRSSKGTNPSKNVLVPGDLNLINRKNALISGIELSCDLVEDINVLLMEVNSNLKL